MEVNPVDKVLLRNIKRYKQDAGACAFAAVASVGNYFDKQITYESVCNTVKPDGQGLYTPDIGLLLNKIGFNGVTIVTADLDYVDFHWKDISRKKLIDELKRSRRNHPDEGCREVVRQYVKFLEKNPNNNLVIDMKFGDHIRESINKGIPVLASFNWHLFFNFPKWNDEGEIDPIKGEFEQHEVVIYGYDDKGVNILDSHHEMYRGKLKKFSSGRYKMSWEILMTVMGSGDLIFVNNYVPERKNELVCNKKS